MSETQHTRLASTTQSSVTLMEPDELQNMPTLRLRLKKPRQDKKVKWREGTVDNEHMNKKKSKCCCQYEKPRAFGESSSESEDECENCHGHVEHKKKENHQEQILQDPAAVLNLKLKIYSKVEVPNNYFCPL